jgi:hypothetical protein
MKIELVLSRFNENIEWIDKISSLFNNIIIYNKGNDDIDSNHTNIKIPNVGREAQTYLHYIIDNYNNLPDYILFSQAHPFDRGWNNNIDAWVENITNLILKKPNKTTPLGWINVETLEICPPIEEHRYQEMNYKKEYERIFNEKYPKEIVYSSGATIWTTRKNILSRDKQFYINLNETVNKEIHPPNAWILERFWLTIFKNV